MKQYKSALTSYIRFLILSCSVLKTVFEFAAKKRPSLFYGKYYYQTDGVAMGSPVGRVLAYIFSCYFEETCGEQKP